MLLRSALSLRAALCITVFLVILQTLSYTATVRASDDSNGSQSQGPGSCFNSTPADLWRKEEVRAMKLLIAIPVHDRLGYVTTTLQALYESWLPPDNLFHVLVVDDQTSQYDLEAVLHQRFPILPQLYSVVHRDPTGPTGADASEMFIAQYFVSHPEYDLLLFLDSDLVLHQEWYAHLQALLLAAPKRAVLSLYHSAAGSHATLGCQRDMCQKESIGNAGAVYSQEVAGLMFPNPIPNNAETLTFDWTWLFTAQKKRIPFCVPQVSVVVHIGMHGSWGELSMVEKALSFRRGLYSPDVRHQLMVHASRANHPSSSSLAAVKIPRHVIQTWPTSALPDSYQSYAIRLQQQHPTWKYTLFNDSESISFLRQRCGERAAEAYRALKPRAHKADLFRYCFMYVNGGVYLEPGAQVLKPLDSIVWASDSFVATLAMPAAASARTFSFAENNVRCANFDGHRSHLQHMTAAACFQFCESLRGCGQCERFAWSEASLECMFSTGEESSCHTEQWLGWAIYSSSGQCDGTEIRTGPRTFFRSTTNTRCRNADDTRSFTIQTSAVACFRYCEMMRGCGQCDYFSWSFANKNCIFSTALRTACEPEPYDGFDMYQGQGQCLGAGQEARTGLWHGFMACAPGLPVMWHAMWTVIRRVEQRLHPALPPPDRPAEAWAAVLALTGPGLLSDCAAWQLRLLPGAPFPYLVSAAPYHMRFLRFRPELSQVELGSGVPVLAAPTAEVASGETLHGPRPEYVDYVRQRALYAPGAG